MTLAMEILVLLTERQFTLDVIHNLEDLEDKTEQLIKFVTMVKTGSENSKNRQKIEKKNCENIKKNLMKILLKR